MSTNRNIKVFENWSRQRKQALLCGVCAFSVAAATALCTAPAAAKSRFKSRPDRAEHARKEPFGSIPKGPLQIFISLSNEQLRLYSDGALVTSQPVATGVPGHPTPLGVFDVIQRDRFHHSNIYSNAPMPYMQRITWSGVALHEGVGLGHPASHGCIRMPHEFAARLWMLPTLGTRVIISRTPLTPVDFADPHLFVHKTQPELSSATPAQPVKTAQSTDGSSTTDATAPSLAAPSAAPAAAPTLTPVSTPADPPAAVTPAGTVAHTADPPPDQSSATATIPPSGAGATEAVATETSGTASPAADPPKATPAPSTPDAAPASPNTLRGTDATQAVPLVTPDGTIPVPAAKPPALAETASAAHGPISIFVSRKTMRIYVRQHFAPLFDAPITMTNPDQPIGTHVFSALDYQSDGATFRWNEVSLPGVTHKTVRVIEHVRRFDAYGYGYGYGTSRMVRVERTKEVTEPGPSPQTPQEALARIAIPPDVIERISELMSPGSSLIVSDQGLGPETGEGTDFIVVSR